MTADSVPASTAAASLTGVAYLLGHGTGNDFLILDDEQAACALDPETIAALSHRRFGLGCDGVIRITTAGALVDSGVLEQLPDHVTPEMWFMDYYNADGSIAEMCGNGVRVFAHALIATGRIAAPQFPVSFPVGTRAGVRDVVVHAADAREASVSVQMGQPRVDGVSTARLGDQQVAGLAVNMGNPHLAVVIPELTCEELQGLDLTAEFVWDDTMFPAGTNLELLTELQDGSVEMRVRERGVGETLSCGTGTVAAAVAALADAEHGTGTIAVRIPGGEVTVEVGEDYSVLTGPSVLVATGHVL